MALRALGQPIFAGIAEFVDDVTPIGRLLVQLDPDARDRPIDLRLEAGAIMFGDRRRSRCRAGRLRRSPAR